MKAINTMYRDERGVVSMIIVMFSALLMTIIVVSFMTLMVKNQQQATADDLSKSAYDSAMAGVEDGKRALTYCLADITQTGCDDLRTAEEECDTLESTGIAEPTTNGSNEEYQLQTTLTGSGDNSLDQAYTCVTINASPNSYQTDLTQDEPLLIPLQSNTAVTQVELSWSPFPERPMTNFPTATGGLLTLDEWNTRESYPPLMRAQLIRLGTGGEVELDSLDGDSSSTLFLYPVDAGPGAADFASDARQENKGLPSPIECTQTSCSAELRYGTSDISTTNQPAYLLLTPLYGSASITLQMFNGANPVDFVDTQAVIDSTGRANTLFRRVSARVDLIPHPTYPNAALSLNGSLCKDFIVTNNPTNPIPAACRP